nr:Chain C, Epstein Barr Virus, Latent membrane protein 2 epitope [synthetic construct]
SSCSSCPLSK